MGTRKEDEDEDEGLTLRITGHPAAIAPTKGERLRFHG